MCSHSLSKGRLTVKPSSVDYEKFATTSDLNYFQWYLEWGMTVSDQSEDPLLLLALKCVPNSQFSDKLGRHGNIKIMISFSLFSDGEPSSDDGETDSHQAIVHAPLCSLKLTRKNDYQRNLIYGRSPACTQMPYKVSLSSFTTNVYSEVKIIYCGCSLTDFGSIMENEQQLRQDIGALLDLGNTSKFSDVKLVTSQEVVEGSNPDQVELFAHKVILAARSPVFANMFEHDMQEKQTNRIEINDVRAEVLKQMLVYIYTDGVPKIKEMANDLLYVADKYQLDNLKAMCERHLSYNLQVSNAAHTVQLAHMHNAPKLKENALRFVSKHITEVRATKEWEEVKKCGDVLDDLIEVMTGPAAKRPRTD